MLKRACKMGVQQKLCALLQVCRNMEPGTRIWNEIYTNDWRTSTIWNYNHTSSCLSSGTILNAKSRRNLSPSSLRELVRAMAKRDPIIFQKCMLGDKPASVILEWWERAITQPWGQGHPAMRDPSVLDEMYPLLFHYDGAEAYTGQEAHIWSMGSFFAAGHIFDCKFLMTLIMHVCIPTPELQKKAHAKICEFIAWSLGYCMLGVAPERGFYSEVFKPKSLRAHMAGKPLAKGQRFCFGGLRQTVRRMCLHTDSSATTKPPTCVSAAELKILSKKLVQS